MPRIARVVAVGLPHHITQRGNFQQDVFLDDWDREKYLRWIQEYSVKYNLSILAYCLMLNHVHFIAVPYDSDSLAKTFNVAHMRYAQYYNKKMDRKGHLWQNRFYSCVLDEPHLIATARYIEQNPVRANLVKKPWQWRWSSAMSHVKKGMSIVELKDIFKLIDIPQDFWKRFVVSCEHQETFDKIRKNTLTGQPLGSKSFVKKIERKIGKKFNVRPVGRPAENR